MLDCSVLALTTAAELTVFEGLFNGPGTFLPGLINSLSTLQPEQIKDLAKITVK